MGFARAAQMPVVADRRHRPRRRHRANRRHEGGARARGRGDDRRLHRQQVPRRRQPVRRRDDDCIAERTGWRALGLVPFFAEAAAPARRGRVRPWRRSKPAPTVSVDDRRAAARRVSPISTISTRCGWSPPCGLSSSRPGEPLPRRRSRHPARQQGDDRRPRLLARAGLGHRSPRPCAARRARARNLRRLSDARARASPIRKGSRGRPARSRASACSTSRPC